MAEARGAWRHAGAELSCYASECCPLSTCCNLIYRKNDAHAAGLRLLGSNKKPVRNGRFCPGYLSVTAGIIVAAVSCR